MGKVSGGDWTAEATPGPGPHPAGVGVAGGRKERQREKQPLILAYGTLCRPCVLRTQVIKLRVRVFRSTSQSL